MIDLTLSKRAEIAEELYWTLQSYILDIKEDGFHPDKQVRPKQSLLPIPFNLLPAKEQTAWSLVIDRMLKEIELEQFAVDYGIRCKRNELQNLYDLELRVCPAHSREYIASCKVCQKSATDNVVPQKETPVVGINSTSGISTKLDPKMIRVLDRMLNFLSNMGLYRTEVNNKLLEAGLPSTESTKDKVIFLVDILLDHIMLTNQNVINKIDDFACEQHVNDCQLKQTACRSKSESRRARNGRH